MANGRMSSEIGIPFSTQFVLVKYSEGIDQGEVVELLCHTQFCLCLLILYVPSTIFQL